MKKVMPGEAVEIRAQTWNSFIDCANYVKNQSESGGEKLKATLPAGMVYVRNDSGEDMEIYSVMSLPDLVISPEDNENFQFGDIVFSADIATEEDDDLPLCILQQPLSADEVGRALVLGVTHGTVDVSDSSHRFAIPSPDEPGGLVSAESGVIEIMWKGEETGEQECILKMGGSGATGECSFPFQLYVSTDEIGDPILCMIPGQITVETVSTMNANFRFGESDSFSDEEVIDFDFNNVADGDYLVLGWVRLSASGNVDCGILIGRDDEMDSTFEYPTGCGFFVFPIGVVEKTGDEEDFPLLTVTKQFACGTFSITDHYYNLPFVPHIQVDVPETNELAVPGDIQAVRAQIINAPCYSDKEEKYSDIADKGTELEPGNTYYAYIEDTGNNVTLVWSNEELDAYEASDETEFELEDNESEGTIKRTLVAEISYGSDGLFQTHHHHLAPYRIVDSEESYMVLVNDEDETPGYLEDKLEADPLDGNEELIYPEDEPGYIKHILNEDYSSEDLNLSLRTVWDYKSIPGYDDFSGAKTLVSSVDDEESLSWEPFGTVKVNDEDEPDFLETKFEDSVTIKFDTTEDNKITAHVSIIEKPETIGSLSHLLEFVLKDDESDGNDTDSGKKVQLRYAPEYDEVLSVNDMLLFDRSGKITRGLPADFSESNESLLTYKRREYGYRIVSNVPPKKGDSDSYVLVGEKDTGIWWIGSDKIGGKTKIISPLKTIIVNDKDEEGNEYEDVLVEVNYSKFISPDESLLIETKGSGEDSKLEFKVDYSKFHSSTNSIEFNADEGLDMNVNLASPDSSILVGTIDESGGIGIMVDYSRFGSSDGSIDIGPGEDGDGLDFRVDYGYFTSEDESLIITELDEGGLDFEVNYEKFYSSDESLIVDPGAEGEGLDLCVDYSRFSSADESLIITEIDDGGLDFGINFEMFDSSDGSLFVEPGAEGEGLDLRVDYSRFGSADDSLIIEEIDGGLDLEVNYEMFDSSDGSLFVEPGAEGEGLDLRVDYSKFDSADDSLIISESDEGGVDFEVNYEMFDSSDGSLFVEPGAEGEGLDLRVDYSKFGSADDSLIIGEIDDGGLNLEVNYEMFDSSDGSLFVEPGVEGEGLDLRVDYSRFFSSDDSIEITELDGGLDFKSDGKVKVSGLDEADYLAGKVESPWGSIDVSNDGDMLQLDVDWSKVRIDSSLSGLIDIDYSEDGVTLKSALNGNGLIVVENGRLRVLQGQPNSLLACTENGFTWLPYSDCANACE